MVVHTFESSVGGSAWSTVPSKETTFTKYKEHVNPFPLTKPNHLRPLWHVSLFFDLKSSNIYSHISLSFLFSPAWVLICLSLFLFGLLLGGDDAQFTQTVLQVSHALSNPTATSPSTRLSYGVEC